MWKIDLLPHWEFAVSEPQEDHKDLNLVQVICKGDADDKQIVTRLDNMQLTMTT